MTATASTTLDPRERALTPTFAERLKGDPAFQRTFGNIDHFGKILPVKAANVAILAADPEVAGKVLRNGRNDLAAQAVLLLVNIEGVAVKTVEAAAGSTHPEVAAAVLVNAVDLRLRKSVLERIILEIEILGKTRLAERKNSDQ